MARQKIFEIKLSEDQKTKLKNALLSGSPLPVALSFARISPVQYYYYVEVANVSRWFKEKEFIKQNDEFIKAGVSFADIREEAAAATTFEKNSNGGINTFKEPTAEAINRYKNNKSFREFADEVYDFIAECDNNRSEAVMFHLAEIRKAAGKRGVNTNSSQWFLERAVPEHFGKNERVTQRIEGSMHQTITQEGDGVEPGLPPVKVQFVSPDTTECKQRVKAMEDLVAEQLRGKDVA